MQTSEPNIIDEIGAVIGTTAALRLLAIFGGTNLYIPEIMPADHPIARAVGFEAATKLSRTFAREQIDLPDGEDFHYLQRVRRVAGLLRGGVSPRDIAMLIGVSARQVSRYRVEAESMGMLPMVFGKSPRR